MRVKNKFPSLISSYVEKPEKDREFLACGGKKHFYPVVGKTYILKQDVEFMLDDPHQPWTVIVPQGACITALSLDEYEAWKPVEYDDYEAYYLKQERTCLVDDDDDDDPEWYDQCNIDDCDLSEAVRFCRKYYPNMPEEECIKVYETYLMYLDEGQTREVSRMYAGLL